MTTTSSPRVRMSHQERREQLLDIGLAMLATRPLEEMSIELLAEEAGISRGLLYHYFANKQEFHLAVVRRAVADLTAVTAPRDLADPMEQLTTSMAAYVDYVVDNYAGYVSLVHAAAGGNEELREIYLQARDALTSRVFEAVGAEELADLGIVDTPAARLLVQGWAALAEEMTISWVAGGRTSCTREQLLSMLAGALPALVGLTD
jgi:AcrR family transcriptional regulator